MQLDRNHAFSATAAIICIASAAITLLGFAPSRAFAPAQLQLGMATLHAAALSKARTPADTADAPYLLITVSGPGSARNTMQMPTANSHWTIRQDEAKGAAPLTSLSVAPGDSVRVLFTLLEADKVNTPEESTVRAALAKLNIASSATMATPMSETLAPLTNQGAHWIGSATMLLTNEGGKTYWRALDCVSTCRISNSPVKSGTEAELAPTATNALAAVVELNGSSATYHLQVTARRSP